MSKEEKAELVPLSGATQVGDLFRLAIEKGMDVEGLEKLVTLHERVADRAAGQEFSEALAAFQNECPPISKSSKATITSKRPGAIGYTYNFADLDQIVRVVRPVLYKHGLSFSWDSDTDGAKIKAVCTLRHANGHSESSSFSCPTGTSAGMSEQQKVASANTFARRQALVQVLGLTLTDPDSDGGVPVGAVITAKMAADLEAMIDEVGANREKFLKYLKVETLEDLPATQFAIAVAALEEKRRRS